MPRLFIGHRVCRIAVFVLAAVSGWGFQVPAAQALSASTRTRAVRLYRSAQKLYKEGRYRKAIEKLRQAHSLLKKPVFLFNIGSCYERLGELERAVTFYRKYLKRCRPGERGQIQVRIDSILRRPSILTVISAPTGAAIRLNGDLQSLRTPARIKVPAGNITVRVELPGCRAQERVLVAGFGKPLVADFTLEDLSGGPKRGGATYLRPPGFLSFSGGFSLQTFGDPYLDIHPTYAFGLDGGYIFWPISRLGLELGASLAISGIDDNSPERSKTLTVLDILAVIGLRARFVRRFYGSIRAGVGSTLILGTDRHSLFFDDLGPEDRVSAVFAGLGLRASLVFGYQVWRSLGVVVSPVIVTYSPRVGSFDQFKSSIKYALRYHLQIGVQYDF